MAQVASRPTDTSAFRRFFQVKCLNGFVLLHAVRTLVDLGVADIMGRAGRPVTVEEIAAQLPSKSVNVEFLERIMTFAAVCGLFTDVTATAAEGELVEDGQRKFELTEVSLNLVEGETSMAHWVRFTANDNSMKPFSFFTDAVLTGKGPYFLSFGKSEWDVGETDEERRRTTNKGMASTAAHVMATLLSEYKGFAGLKRVVDVGGGFGASLAAIVGAHPSIRGINFDLAHVVAGAPAIAGVEHVGGDMFESVPEGDAILMKNVLHDWSDQECVQILKNCGKSLPESGKVIIIERVIPEPDKATPEQYMWDLAMLAQTSGRERTAERWTRVLKQANFRRVEIIPVANTTFSIIEAYTS